MQASVPRAVPLCEVERCERRVAGEGVDVIPTVENNKKYSRRMQNENDPQGTPPLMPSNQILLDLVKINRMKMIL